MTQVHISYDTIHAWTLHLAREMDADQFKPDLVVGITRGGLLPAQILSHYYQVPMWCHHMSLRDHAHLTNDTADWFASYVIQNKGVLVVDDVNDRGDTIRWMTRHLQERLPWSSHTQYMLHDHVRFAVLLNKVTSAVQADFWAQSVSESDQHIWWEFPWEKTT